MSAERAVRIAGLAALGLFSALLAGVLLLAVFWEAGAERFVGNRIAGIGGPFELRRTDGTPFTDKDVEGRPHIVYFGFTFCPDLCPTTLYQLADAREGLGAAAQDLAILFVSVDPERDTPAVLDSYAAAFPGVTALTGTEEQLNQAARTFGAYFRRVPLQDGGYTVDHTTTALLFERDSAFAGTIPHDATLDEAREKVAALLDEDAPRR